MVKDGEEQVHIIINWLYKLTKITVKAASVIDSQSEVMLRVAAVAGTAKESGL